MTELYFRITAKGKKRAYIWSDRGKRYFPIPLAEAELLVATGKVKVIDASDKI